MTWFPLNISRALLSLSSIGLLVGFIFLTLSVDVYAHSGRTDSSGCHHDRKNGGYHCHYSDVGPVSLATAGSVDVLRSPASSGDSEVAQVCCIVCRRGKACGNSCIFRSYTCTKPPGCACDAR